MLIFVIYDLITRHGRLNAIAISGFNIAILAAILLRGSRPFVGFRGSAWVALGGVAIYTVLVCRATRIGGTFITNILPEKVLKGYNIS